MKQKHMQIPYKNQQVIARKGKHGKGKGTEKGTGTGKPKDSEKGGKAK